MRFALIGDLAEAALLAKAIHGATGHELGSCCVSGPLAEAMTQDGLPFSLVSSYEEAILDTTAECVVIAISDSETSIANARQTSQADRHVIAVLPNDASTAFGYELHLLLDESQYGIVGLSGRWYVDPNSASETSANESTKQIRLECSGSEAQLHQFGLHVIDAMCGLGFDYNRITGMDLPASDGRLLSRTITLGSAESEEQPVPPAIAVFTIAPGEQHDAAISLTGESSVTIPTALPHPAVSALANECESLVDRLVDRLQDRTACANGMETLSNSLEIHQALAKSLRRRRTIDVYFDGVSERGVFKTQMTAIGCGILGYMTFGLVAYLIFAQLFEPANWVLQLARGLWIAPVVIFLLAQLLLPLTKHRKESAPEDS